MSMPRVVSLSQEGEVQINPPEEVEALRLSGITESNLSLEPNSEIVLDARGTSLEIEVEMVGRSSPFGVKVFSSPDGSEETLIKYEPESKELVIDFARSAVSGKGQVTVLPNCMLEAQMEGFTENVSEQRAPFELKKGESLKLNIFIDRSIIEVFANGRQCVTQVVYPELSDSDGVKLFSGGDLVQVLSAKVWKMATTNAY
jgi:beta-fructofuranosidase